MTNPADFYTSYADRFKLLGHPMRLQILDALRRTPECVCHLEALNVYHHLVGAQMAALLNAALGPVLPGERGPHQALSDCVCPRWSTTTARWSVWVCSAPGICEPSCR
jgi:hypothetical protein